MWDQPKVAGREVPKLIPAEAVLKIKVKAKNVNTTRQIICKKDFVPKCKWK
jgi:hypothetical protein